MLAKNELLACLDEWMEYIKKHLGINSHSFKAYQRIYQIIQNQPEKGRILTGMAGEMFNEAHENQPEVDEEFIEKWVKGCEQLYINGGDLWSRFLLNLPCQLIRMFKEAGYNVIKKSEIDVNEIIDCVLQNSYVVYEKTSDGSGREYYDNQLFPEKGCEEKVKKLLQRIK